MAAALVGLGSRAMDGSDLREKKGAMVVVVCISLARHTCDFRTQRSPGAAAIRNGRGGVGGGQQGTGRKKKGVVCAGRKKNKKTQKNDGTS